MAVYTRQNLTEQGVSLTANAATVTVGDSSDNSDGKLAWIVRNGSGAGITASVAVVNAPSLSDPVFGTLTKGAIAFAVGAGATAVIGPFPPAVFNDANFRVTLVCSSVTSVTVSPVKLP
jgi:hypothetical protein